MKEKIYEAFVKAGQPKRPGDIAKERGVDSKDVSREIKTLKDEGRLISPKRCYYSPA